MRYRCAVFSVLLLIPAVAASVAAGELDLPQGRIAGGEPGKMMHQYWLRQVERATQRWQKDYEARKSAEQISEYQARLHKAFIEAIGGFPERTPLAPQVTGTVMRDGYRVEKIIFQCQPKHYVTGLLFLPDADRVKPPYPGVLVPCGHAMKAKSQLAYQTMGGSAGTQRHGGLCLRPDRSRRARPVSCRRWLAEALGHASPLDGGRRLHVAGTEHSPIRDLGRDARNRLSAVSSGSRSGPNRMHRQQRRRHSDVLSDGLGRSAEGRSAELLPLRFPGLAAHDRPSGR